eukprot:TRINITY_DN355_c0_g5_i1.p1 TRINITY_DN355_c0_g5~~TRINITY_DN355_c0_g5_i1.p1  ORF type:complete len:201 (+),score=52.91 TRINITY_DN355_c0_g5_i1:51-653(+)
MHYKKMNTSTQTRSTTINKLSKNRRFIKKSNNSQEILITVSFANKNKNNYIHKQNKKNTNTNIKTKISLINYHNNNNNYQFTTHKTNINSPSEKHLINNDNDNNNYNNDYLNSNKFPLIKKLEFKCSPLNTTEFLMDYHSYENENEDFPEFCFYSTSISTSPLSSSSLSSPSSSSNLSNYCSPITYEIPQTVNSTSCLGY